MQSVPGQLIFSLDLATYRMTRKYCSFIVEVRDFSVARSVQTGSVVTLASCSADIRGDVLGGKAIGPWSWQLPPSTIEV